MGMQLLEYSLYIPSTDSDLAQEMVNLFEINLESPPSPKGYPSGSTLKGTVVVETGEDENYELIEVSLEGTGKVTWTTRERKSSQTHTAKESYVNESVTVWSDEGQSRVLTAGHHEFPFTFSIPNSCPPSYYENDGNVKAYVRYVVKARIANKGLLKLDHTVEKQITVAKEVCLDHTTAEPVRKGKGLAFTCFCYASGAVILTVELPRTGFIAGDRIPLSIDLENGRSRNLRIEASLIRKANYSTRTAGCVTSHTEVKECSNYFNGRSTVTWSPETLVVPNVRSTMRTPRGMISLSYEVEAQVSLGLLETLEVSIPVTIADVPFCTN